MEGKELLQQQEKVSCEGFIIRHAELAETDIVLDMQVEAARRLMEKGISQWEYLLKNDTREETIAAITAGMMMIVLDQHGQAAASFQLSDQPSEWDVELWGKDGKAACYLHRFVVHSDFQKKQLGLKLLRWLKQYTKQHGVKLRLDCIQDNAVLNAYYQANGFTYQGNAAVSGTLFSLYEAE